MSKQPSKKAAAKKAAAKKVPAAKKAAGKKAPAAKKAARKKPVAKKADSGKKTAAKKAAAPKKASAAKKASAKKAPVAKKVAAKKAAVTAKSAAEAIGSGEGEVSAAEEKAATSPGGFTLDDVRSILQRKGDSSDAKKETAATSSKREAKKDAADAEAPKGRQRPAKAAPAKKKAASASVADILGFNPSKSSTPPDRDEANVSKKWKPFFNSLMRFRSQLKEALGERTEETIGANAREASGELSVNSADAGTQTFDRDVALSMVAGEQETLHEVEAALDRIFAGTYGVCEETGKPIKLDRLRAVPFTRFSLEGQAQYEKRGRRSAGSGGGVFANLSEASLGDDEA